MVNLSIVADSLFISESIVIDSLFVPKAINNFCVIPNINICNGFDVLPYLKVVNGSNIINDFCILSNFPYTDNSLNILPNLKIDKFDNTVSSNLKFSDSNLNFDHLLDSNICDDDLPNLELSDLDSNHILDFNVFDDFGYEYNNILDFFKINNCLKDKLVKKGNKSYRNFIIK